MISYAQNFEDVVLHRVFRDRKDGFYIDVGAWDPVVDSVTKFFYDEGWSGINIEPNECFYRKLMQDRPRDINLNFALGEREEDRPFYLFEEYGHSSFDESARDHFARLGYEAKQSKVKVTTLAAICRDYVKRQIDFLKVDCEGWEKFVIRGADWDRFRPTVLVIEATQPGTATPSWPDWEPYVVENGRYEMVYFDGLNRFYLRREYAELRSCFEVPPNVFDGFKPYAAEAAEQASRELRNEFDRLSAQVLELNENLNRAEQEKHRLTGVIQAKEEELSGLQARVLELEKECCELKETLLKTRLWVGRLSQDLAATKRRP